MRTSSPTPGSGVRVLKHEQRRAEAAEQEVRNLRRADEKQNLNVPRGFKVSALVFQSQPATRIARESDRERAGMIDKAIHRLNNDTLYIMEREMFAERFGPIDRQKRKYGRLRLEDAQAEIVRLQELGLVETVKDGDQGLNGSSGLRSAMPSWESLDPGYAGGGDCIRNRKTAPDTSRRR